MNKSLQDFYNNNQQTFSKNAFLFKEVNKRCLDRLQFIKLSPDNIVDLGAGPVFANKYLLEAYSTANLISIDFAANMLEANNNNTKLLANASATPIKTASVDLVYCNLMLHWQPDLAPVFIEVNRILKDDGLFMFSCFGVDTLSELRAAFATIDQFDHVNAFYDMHDLGDGLLQLGFADPVMDMELMTVEYQDFQTIISDLNTVYGPLCAGNTKKSLMTRRQLQRVQMSYQQAADSNKALPVSFEIIYGHAWKKASSTTQYHNEQGEVVVPLSELVKK